MGLLKDIYKKTTFGKAMDGALTSNEIIDILYEGEIFNNEEQILESIKKAGTKAEEISPFSKPENCQNPFEKNRETQKPNSENNNGAQKYMQLFNKHHRPEMNVLFKPEKDITEAEILAASKFSNYESKDYELNDRVHKKVKGWYEQNYGTQPVRRDATGRQIDPEPKFKLPEQEIPVRTKEGSVMEESLSKLARKMVEIDADETPDTGVSALQKSLNRLGYAPELKEDGKLGPKTSLQTRAYLAENGFGRVFQALNRKVYL